MIASRRTTSINGLSDLWINWPLRSMAILLICLAPLASAQKKPCSKEEIVNSMLRRHVASAIVLKKINDRGVDFQLTESDASEFRRLGATEEIINAIEAEWPGQVP